MHPDAYLIVAAGWPLYAPTLRELAEVAECALGAGDGIELLLSRDAGRWRPLSQRELERFLAALAGRPT